MSFYVLSKDDLRQLTGASHRKLQEEWLIKNRIPFLRNVKGEITTTPEAINERILGRQNEILVQQQEDIGGFKLPKN